MIKESYVRFDTAKLLKEAGFDVPCECYYSWFDGKPIKGYCDGKVNHNRDKSEDADISRPTQDLAARWLREVHGIDVLVDIDTIILPTKRRKYNVKIFIDKSIYCISGGHNSYENAIEKGIQKAIKLIKQ